MVSSELTDYLVLGDGLACLCFSSPIFTRAPWGWLWKWGDKCTLLSVVHGTMQAEAFVWLDWILPYKVEPTVLTAPLHEGRNQVRHHSIPLRDPLKVYVMVPDPDLPSEFGDLFSQLPGGLPDETHSWVPPQELPWVKGNCQGEAYLMIGRGGVQRAGSLVSV